MYTSIQHIYIYMYVCVCICVCMYMYIHQFQLVGVNNHPETPKFSEREQLLGVPKRIFMPTAWTTNGLSFFWHFLLWKNMENPAIFQLQMYYRVIYQVLSTTKQSAHSTPKYSISLWSSPCFLSAKTAKSSWVVHTFLVNVGVIETVNCWPFHWKIYG